MSYFDIRKTIISSNFCNGRILIIDFCSQYTQLIARRVREFGVYCEVWSIESILTEQRVRQFSPSGIVLSGSFDSINNNGILNHHTLRYIFYLGVPVLGICYGMHIMVSQFGGKVRRDLLKREFGSVQLKIISNSTLMQDIYDVCGVDKKFILNVWMSHQDTVVSLPSNFSVIGITGNNNISIIADEEKRLYGLQFHPEVTHTLQGVKILKRFVLDICSCKSSGQSLDIVSYLIDNIREIIQNDSVVLAFSGGIDSVVTALLLQRAIGNEKLFCLFIDSGLLRYNEFNNHIKMLIKNYSLNVINILASDRFFNALIGITDPEEKRKVIGKVFVEIFEDQKHKYLPHVKWLVQGTICSDVIESGNFVSGVYNKKLSVIKSHHNVGGLSKIKSMNLLEPLKNLFKDEVRNIGKLFGLSDDILYRHPFPGPGLGIRILGEIKKEYCDLLRQADNIFIEELKRHCIYKNISQAFVVFLPIRSVGIVGDIRKYEWVVALRAVESIDFMTARWARLSYDILGVVSNRIINEIQGISRVVYDISNKPPGTIEWE